MEDLVTFEEAKSDLISCAVYLAGNISSNEAQAVALKEIVAYYLEKGDVDHAAQFADVVNDNFARNQMLVAVISKCVELDDDEYAFQLIEAIDENGIRAKAREAIALKTASKGEFEKAFEIADTLEHSSDAFAGIAVNQAIKGFETEAVQTLSKVDFYKSTVDALQEISIHFLKAEEAGKAIDYLERAFELVDEIEFTEDKIRALMEIGSLFVEAEKNDRAIEVFARASAEIEKLEGIHKDNLFANIAVGFLRAGSIDLADRTLDAVEDKVQVSNCLLGFSQVFEKDGDKEEALDSLEESYAILKSQKESEIRDSKSRFQLFASIATQFARLEKIERALEIAHENPTEEQKNLALTNIAQLCIMQDKDEMANQALKGIESDASRLTSLITMSDAKKRAEKNDEATELLNEAEALIDTIPQFIARTDIQNEISKRFADYSDFDRAREVATDSLKIIGEILGDNNRSIALTELAKVFDKNQFQLSETDKETLELMVRKSNW